MGWLFNHVNGKIVLSHDIQIHASFSRQTLWDKGPITSWEACAIICAQGYLIYLAVCTPGDEDQQGLVKLVEWKVDESSRCFSEPVECDVPKSYSEDVNLRSISKNGPFLFIYDEEYQPVVFDIRTRIFYEFPKIRSESSHLCNSLFPMDAEILCTMTHILIKTPLRREGRTVQDAQLLQAFVVPDSPALGVDRARKLHFSHEVIHYSPRSTPFELIHNSIVNGDGSTRIRFLACDDRKFSPHTASDSYYNTQCTRLYCLELSLPPFQTDAVLPIFLSRHELFEIDGKVTSIYLRASDDGFVRGFLSQWIYQSPLRIAGSGSLRQFTIDASGESGCMIQAVLAEEEVPLRSLGLYAYGMDWFGLVRGMVCYVDEYRRGRHDTVVDNLE